jgi:anti-anti-sigma regulatory factor
MNAPSAKILVLVGEKFACVKISGRATFASSIDLRTLINQLREKGYSYFVLDLSECTLMDSTFLGVLAGFGLSLRARPVGPDGPAIELRNPNARILELFETLGVLPLFRVTQGPLTLPEGCQSSSPAPTGSSRAEITKACLEAHETLMQLNPENVSRFREVSQFLAEDLKKLKAAG